LHRFADLTLNDQPADAMVMDIEHQGFKYIWYTKPAQLDEVADLQHSVGSQVPIDIGQSLEFTVDSYQHKTKKVGMDPLIIRIGSKEAVYQQLTNMYTSLGLLNNNSNAFKFVINVDKIAPPISPASKSTTQSR
jgi:hypothetical protein